MSSNPVPTLLRLLNLTIMLVAFRGHVARASFSIELLNTLYGDLAKFKAGTELGMLRQLVRCFHSQTGNFAIRVMGEITEKIGNCPRIWHAILWEEPASWSWPRHLAILYCYHWGPICWCNGWRPDLRLATPAIRAITSIDGMTADSCQTSLGGSAKSLFVSSTGADLMSNNRIVYDITSKPPATVEWIINKSWTVRVKSSIENLSFMILIY